MYFILLCNFQLPFGDDDEVTFNKDNEITCHDLAQSFVNLELGRVKIETTQQVMLHNLRF